jgi:hypothetical protein
MQGMESFDRTFPTTFEYITGNYQSVIPKIYGMFVENLKSLLDFAFFGLLSIPLMLFFIQKKSKFRIELIFCIYLFTWYSVVWSAFVESERGFMIIYLLLLIPAFLTLKNLKPVLASLIIVTTLFSYIILDVHRINWARNADPAADDWSDLKRGKVYAWIKQNTKEDAIIAAPSPWLLNLFTQRPSIILPGKINPNEIKKFAKKYNVSFVVTPGKNNVFSKFKTVYSENDAVIYCLNKCL